MSRNWKQMLDTHPDRGTKEVSVFNMEYRQRQIRGQRYLPNAGIVATEDNVHFTVVNRCTDQYEEQLSEDQVEPAMTRLNIANSSWGWHEPFLG